MDEVLARLLAVGHDVDAGRLLVLERRQHGVALALGQALRRQRHGAHSALRLGEPAGLGQTPGDRRQQHQASLRVSPRASAAAAPPTIPRRRRRCARYSAARDVPVPYRARIQPAAGHSA